MGRFQKIVYGQNGVDKRESGYYSTPAFIAEFIATETRAQFPSASSVFDPCIGAGELVLPFLERGLRVEGVDISEYGVPDGITFSQADFLKYFAERSALLPMQASCYNHDILVANPPYNCHEVEYIRRHKDMFGRRQLSWPVSDNYLGRLRAEAGRSGSGSACGR